MPQREEAMNAIYKVMLPTLISSAMLVSAASNASAETLKQKIVGTWTVVSVVNDNKGNKTETFGPHPIGYFIFDRTGHVAIQIMKSDIPKFASNNKNTGTDTENKAVVQGSIANFGTYKIDEKDHSASMHYIGSSYPNWNGTDQKRSIAITGDQMSWTDPATPFGGTAVVMLKRAK
jgi:hypothetical protein